MTTGVKLALGGVIVASITGYMAFLGASTSWQYYLTVDECVANAESLGGSRLRVNGRVAQGSLQIAPDRTQAQFQLEGGTGLLNVTCRGPLPDNLKEQINVVVEGKLGDSQTLNGDRVLTKCASKYQSEELAEQTNHNGTTSEEGTP